QALKTAWEHAETEDEAALLRKIQTQVREFLAQPEIPSATRDPSAFSHYLEGTQEVDSIGEDVGRLIDINVEQANAARDESLRRAATVFERNNAGTPPEQLQHQMQVVRRQIDRLERMTSDFLDMSLIENGQFTLQTETRDIRLLAQNVVELFEPTSTKHRLEL